VADEIRKLLEEIPWPEDDDKLFYVNFENFTQNAYIDEHSDANWAAYIYGYKMAADILVNHLQSNKIDLNFLIFPIAFLYRQYLELQLKQIIKDGNLLLDHKPDFPKEHRLDKLWEQARVLITEVFSGEISTEYTNSLDIVEKQILEFSEFDKYSTAFRYPTDKSNNPPFLNTLNFLDLENMKAVVGKMESLLTGAYSGICEKLDHKFSSP